MRARNIKPGFFKSEQLVECSFQARLFFAGLWCYCDAFGRGENRAKKMKMEIFPGDDADIPALLAELIAQGLVVLYGDADDTGTQPYLWIPAFERHQNPHINEKKRGSELPSPPMETASEPVESDVTPGPLRVESGTSTVLAPDSNGTNRADSRYRIPDSGLLIADTRYPKAGGTRAAVKSEAPVAPSSASAVLSGMGFDDSNAAKRHLLSRLMALGDPPGYEAWWRQVINRMAACDGLGTLFEALDHAEQCGDAKAREAKGLGNLTSGSRYVASVCRDYLKRHGKSLPRCPGPSQ